MIVGGYTLDLYCDSGREVTGGMGEPLIVGHDTPAQFYGPSLAHTSKQAKRAGWRIDLTNRLAYCPQCERERKTKKGARVGNG